MFTVVHGYEEEITALTRTLTLPKQPDPGWQLGQVGGLYACKCYKGGQTSANATV